LTQHGGGAAPDPAPDDELVERFQATRDYDCFDEIVRRHQEPLARYAVLFLGDRELARDAVQDCFLRAFRTIGRYTGSGKLAAWLFTLLRSSCLDALRRDAHQRDTRGTETAAAGRAVGGAAFREPGAEAERRERSEAVRRALASLPEGYREAVILRFFQGLGYAEMGEVLGASETACRQRVHNAVRKLADVLPAGI
jgi:RNA polymerase sigma-70 factor (ECF subfamily)